MKMNKKLFFILICVLCAVFGFALNLNAQALGDVNKSGAIDINDALLTARYAAGFTLPVFYSELADVNCSGKADINDALLIARYCAGVTPPFQPCQTITPTPTRTPTATPTATPTPSPTAKLHVFLLMGQSNMAGYPAAQAADKVEDPRVIVLGFDACSATGRQKDQWDIAAPPLHDCWANAIGPGDWFAKTVIQRLPQADSIALIPCAFSGQPIEYMSKGGAQWSWIVSRGKAAKAKGGVIEGILFHQGESNNGQADWPNKVAQMVKDLKAEIGFGDVPFLAGELTRDNSAYANHNTLVAKLPGLIPNCFVISSSGLALDPADTAYRCHFNHDSQVTFGKRYAEKMISALGW